MHTINKLGTFALTLLITGAIDSIRNLPGSALFGSTLIFFFIFSAIVFLIPTALVSAELTASMEDGGIYHWCRRAFGERIGFLAIWIQWISNVVWFPTILSFIAGTAAYLIDPMLAQNKFYLVGVILFIFWLVTFINMRAIHVSSKFTSFCAMAGLIFPMILIIGLFIVWLILGKPVQFHLTSSNVFPSFSQTDNWIALTAIITGFVGMELATVHIKEVSAPKKTFPKALIISTVLILVTMILGSLAIAMVLPATQVNLVNGTIQTFVYFLSAYHLNWLTPILIILIVMGSLGGISSWVISPIKGISQAADHGFLPQKFAKLNKHGMPQNLLLIQAILVSLVCLAFLLLPSINGSYWLLTSLSTQLYVVMYALMFIAALRLRTKIQLAHLIPGKKFGLWLVCLLGLVGCLATLVVGFIPPNNINIGSKFNYELIYVSSMLMMIAPIFFFYRYQRLSVPLLQVEDGLVGENI